MAPLRGIPSTGGCGTEPEPPLLLTLWAQCISVFKGNCSNIELTLYSNLIITLKRKKVKTSIIQSNYSSGHNLKVMVSTVMLWQSGLKINVNVCSYQWGFVKIQCFRWVWNWDNPAVLQVAAVPSAEGWNQVYKLCFSSAALSRRKFMAAAVKLTAARGFHALLSSGTQDLVLLTCLNIRDCVQLVANLSWDWYRDHNVSQCPS